jgi:pimeloyl-ACP methyl ester carboxylesterase
MNKSGFVTAVMLSLFVVASLLSIGSVGQAFPNASVPASVPVYEQKNLASRGFFFVGGHYTGEEGKQAMDGQMYVEVLVPKESKHPYPLVLFHGAGQTAINWMGTPDGRKGWADYFLEQGYIVYMVDQPARGRSAYHPEIDGNIRNFSAPFLEKVFTTASGDWLQAKKHSQWPGDGRMGDSVFDAFYATQVESLASNAKTQKLVQDAGAALLDKIGPAILVTHSQAGAFGWLIADVRPEKVKGIVAIEPLGPPFQDAIFSTGKARSWGLTDIPITYDPPANDPSELAIEEVSSDIPGITSGWMQKSPARKLPNLRGIPILIVSTEASYHAAYDQWTAKYLEQAGVKNTYIRLEDYGIYGNGHMCMLEKNNLEIAGFLNNWVNENIK